ncbi:hypothetical protein C6Y44_09985 [Rhodococcus rhodochrous]|nr:hypothetical protein C6Y44_09985 [Rhodococcus rhodochrous]
MAGDATLQITAFGTRQYGTFTAQSLSNGNHTLQFTHGSTSTFDDFLVNGSSSHPLKLRSWVAGDQYTLSSAGYINVSYVDIKDSAATGGATWSAYNSTNSGNNTGWNFIGPSLPVANFSASPTSGPTALTVNFTDTSTGIPTSWLWNFGDGTTSTAQNPTKTYTAAGSYTVSLKVTNSLGTTTKALAGFISVSVKTISNLGGDATAEADGTLTVKPGAITLTLGGDASEAEDGMPHFTYNVWDAGGDASAAADGELTVEQGPPPPPGELDWSNLGTENKKEYIYKVRRPDGSYYGVWNDVKDDPEWTQQINTPGTTTTVLLARSANQTIQVREPLVDHTGEPYVDQDGEAYYITSETSNTVGEDTDVQMGYLVDIYAVYGGYEELVDQDGVPYVDQDGNPYIVSTGAPMGRRVFSGKIIDYEASYGETTGVTVTIESHGIGLATDDFVRAGSATTVIYSAQPPEEILKTVLDTDPGEMTWSNDSIDATGLSITQKFQLNTKLEAVKGLYNQSPEGWYWYGNVADNLIYLKEVATEPHHVFTKRKDIKVINPKQSIENLINVVHVIGGETSPGGPQLYKEYIDITSVMQWGRKVHRITDRRITLEATAQRYAQKMMSLYSQPIYTTTLEVSSGAYDIETIQLGQMVGFRNFDNFIDGLVLQIVSLSYTPRKVTVQLGGVLDSQQRIVADIQETLLNEQFEKIPTSPS